MSKESVFTDCIINQSLITAITDTTDNTNHWKENWGVVSLFVFSSTFLLLTLNNHYNFNNSIKNDHQFHFNLHSRFINKFTCQVTWHVTFILADILLYLQTLKHGTRCYVKIPQFLFTSLNYRNNLNNTLTLFLARHVCCKK